MKQTTKSPLGLYTIGVAALFLAGFFLLVVFGAKSYRDTVAAQDSNNAARALLGFFETCVSSNDNQGSLYVEDSQYGQVLVIPDGDSGYGLRLYCYDGYLINDYASLGSDLLPDQEIPIARTEEFRVEQLEDGLLRIFTDAGSILVHSRVEGGDGVS